jgi:hypothetical protein
VKETPAEQSARSWWRRIGALLAVAALWVVLAASILGQLGTDATSWWSMDPRLWHAHPLTEPSGLIVTVVGVLLAALVGSVISWWGKRSR